MFVILDIFSEYNGKYCMIALGVAASDTVPGYSLNGILETRNYRGKW